MSALAQIERLERAARKRGLRVPRRAVVWVWPRFERAPDGRDSPVPLIGERINDWHSATFLGTWTDKAKAEWLDAARKDPRYQTPPPVTEAAMPPYLTGGRILLPALEVPPPADAPARPTPHAPCPLCEGTGAIH